MVKKHGKFKQNMKGLCTSDVVVDVNVMMQKSKQVVELADRTADLFYLYKTCRLKIPHLNESAIVVLSIFILPTYLENISPELIL